MTHYALILFYVAIAVGVVFMAGYDYCARKHKDALEELERWRCYWHETRAWLAEFKDAVDALEHLNEVARGKNGSSIDRVREAMRRRRDAAK